MFSCVWVLLLIVISMSCRMTTTRFLLPVLRLAGRQHVHATATRSCSSRSMDRYFGYHVPIRKPPPESPAANINRITDSTDPLTEDVDPEFLDSIAPELPIAYNLAAFVNRSPSLQQLVRLGVDLSVVEKDAEVAEMLLRLDFERDMKPHIQALVDLGIQPDDLGPFITENPAIFEVSINNMKARVEYLRSKKFPNKYIVKILTGYPPFLSHSIKEVDARLGFLQQEYFLEADQLRNILINHPRVMALGTGELRVMHFTLTDLMGFEHEWTRKLIVELPAILSVNHQTLVNVFDILHNTGNIKHGLMVRFPEVFLMEERQVRDRIVYLKLLGRDQFDPELPLYVPLTAISIASDEVFATKYARTSEADYDLFLKNR